VLAGRSKGGFEEIGELASENRENFKQLIQNLKDVTQALKEGRGSVGKALATPELHDEAVAAIKDARSAIGEMKKTGETAQAEIKRLGDNLAKITEKIDKGQGPVPALLNDKKMTDKLDKTLSEVETAATNLKNITEKVDKGEGPLGKLVNDKDMGERLKRTVENIEQTSESIKNVSRKLEAGEGTVGKLIQDEELYNKAKQVIEDVDKTFGRAARAEVDIYTQYQTFDESLMSISRLGVRIAPSPDKEFILGAAFIGLDKDGPIRFDRQVNEGKSDTEIKPEILLGYRVPWFLDGRFTVRGGLIEGKPGGMVNLRWDDWLAFTHPVDFTFMARDAYNDLDDEDIDEEIRGAMMRATAKMPIWTRKANWFELLLSTVRLYGGVNAIDARPEFFAGIGLEWPDEDIRTLVGLFSVVR
jgi:predicted  nucleic acid-binding Zn-ribbon protein